MGARVVRGRRVARVAIDLSRRYAAEAVAVDQRGRLVGWASLEGPPDLPGLARRALETLRVRPRVVRLVVGGDEAGGAVLERRPQEARTVAAALAAEGFRFDADRLAWSCAVDEESRSHVVAALPDDDVAELATALEPWAPAGPELAFAPLVAHHLARGVAPRGRRALLVGDAGLVHLVLTGGGAPVELRALRCGAGLGRDLAQDLRDLRRVRLLGRGRGPLGSALAGRGLPVEMARLPTCRGATLPDGLELAWELARAPALPEVRSASLDARRRELTRARAVLRWSVLALIASAGLGSWAALEGSVLQEARSVRARRYERLAERVTLAREVGDLAEATRRLEERSALLALPWPRLGELLHALPESQPEQVGWERAEVEEGALTLEVSASGAEAEAALVLLEESLTGAPGLADLAWEPARADPVSGALLQTFRAAVVDGGEEGP